MRILMLAAGAALILSQPALASERGGGGHRPPPHQPPHQPNPCGGGCRPPTVNRNINVNVNANASASAQASASSYVNARAYASGMDVGGYRGGGTVYVGSGGYGGDYVQGVGGGYVHVDDRNLVPYGPSAPFGYVVSGFGRDYRGSAPWVRRDDRYGREGRWEERRESYSESHYERWESSEEYRAEVEAAWEFEILGRESSAYDRGYDDGRADCDCRRPDREPPHGVVSADPPHFEDPAYRYLPSEGEPYAPAYSGDLPPPDAPRMAPPPRHGYRQEPGERG